MTNVHELMEHMMREKEEKTEHNEYLNAISNAKKPLSFRTDEFNHFVVDVICKDFMTKKADFCRSLFECALEDAWEKIGYDLTDLQVKYIEFRKTQKQEK